MILRKMISSDDDQFHCACGSDEFFLFGRYNEAETKSIDRFLVYILTCCKCGEQLRIYQTSDEYRTHVKALETK